MAVSTLLGPERTTGAAGAAVVVSERQAWPGRSYRSRDSAVAVIGVWWVVVWVVGWLLVENCTVDASILFSVVKLSRANGGCLGTRSR